MDNRLGYSCALVKHMEPGSCCVACNGDISDSCTWISISLGLSLFEKTQRSVSLQTDNPGKYLK